MKNKLLCGLFAVFLAAGCTEPEQQQVFRSMDDVAAGKTIGVLLGSAQDKFATEQYPDAKILRIDMAPDLAMALRAGTCDAAFFDGNEAESLLKVYPDFGVLENNVCASDLGFGFRPDNGGLLAQFNAFLKQLREEGVYDEICHRWLDGVDSLAVMPDIPLPGDGDPMRVGTACCTVPFSFMQDGGYAGVDMEIVYRFSAHLNRPIRMEVMNFGGLIPALMSGRLDMIANSVMITPERTKQVAFSDPYYQTHAMVLAQKKNLPESKGYASMDDLDGKRVAVLMGSTHDAYLTTNYPGVEIRRIETETDILLALQGRRSEALVLDNTVYKNFCREYKNMSILEEALFVEPFGVGFNYNRLPLRDAFNAFLGEIKESGLYDEIYRRWIDSVETARMPVLDIPTEGTPIKAAITGTTMPFTFVREGAQVGFDVELLSRFAEKMHRPICFENINFGGLIAALSSGKVDVISAGMTINEERSKNVAFSDVYFESKATLAVLSENAAGHQGVAGAGEPDKGFLQRVEESFYNNIVAEHRYQLILDGLGITLLISVLSAVLGTFFGAVVCYLRMSRRKALRWLGSGYISLMRGMPLLVLLMLMYYVVFARWDISATVVAIITFALNFAAYVSEMFRTSIEGVDRGQTEAGIALGFTPVQSFIHIVMPQAIKKVLPVYKGELISLIKMTSIVGYIAVEDLTKASDIIRSRTFDAFFPLIMVAIIYFILAWLFAAVLDYFNRKYYARS